MTKRLVAIALAVVALYLPSSGAAQSATAQQAEPTCDGCATVFFLGVPVYYFCIPGGGLAFVGCQSDGTSCWGSACDLASTTVVPLIERLARVPDGRDVLERVVAAESRFARWVMNRSAIEIMDCTGQRLAIVALTAPEGSRIARGR
jgi:hypothetical protein